MLRKLGNSAFSSVGSTSTDFHFSFIAGWIGSTRALTFPASIVASLSASQLPSPRASKCSHQQVPVVNPLSNDV
ncbi:uncharacterized protein EI90DRAFT_3035385, partial [Cantharellus anzutake]|uniref:uncharacterized protein n=1 Tax=Cantharellus anzutake TaxID=1750568 RepID=UPI001904EEF7